MSNGNRIFEEREVPERRDAISRKVTFKTDDGIVREITIAFCDYCGIKLNMESIIALCCNCGIKLGSECIVQYNGGKSYCLSCIKTIINLSTEAMKILYLTCSEHNIRKLERLLHMHYREIRAASIELTSRKLVERKFPSRIRGYKITHRGLDTLAIVTEILRREGRL